MPRPEPFDSRKTRLVHRRHWLGIAIGSSAGWVAALTTPRLGLAQPARAAAPQDDSPSDPTASQRGESREITWEMGVRVSVAGGEARGLVATFPEPKSWPEQELLETIDQFDRSLKVTTKDLEEGGRLSTVRIPRLAPSDTVEVVRRFRLTKWWLEPPTEIDSLQIPQRIDSSLRGYLQPSPYIESRDRRILDIAQQLQNQPGLPWERVEGIYRWVREHVRYEFDETIRSCIEALDRGVGDCEEMSSLFIALCRASGVPARAVWIPGHTYPEFLLEDAKGEQHWYPCQVAGEAHDFGRMPEWRPILQKGDRFRVPGGGEPQRYLSPKLSGQQAEGTPKLEWILREVMA